MRLTLFQRDDCPLCDEAYERLAVTGVADFEPVWIDGGHSPFLARPGELADLLSDLDAELSPAHRRPVPDAAPSPRRPLQHGAQHS